MPESVDVSTLYNRAVGKRQALLRFLQTEASNIHYLAETERLGLLEAFEIYYYHFCGSPGRRDPKDFDTAVQLSIESRSVDSVSAIAKIYTEQRELFDALVKHDYELIHSEGYESAKERIRTVTSQHKASTAYSDSEYDDLDAADRARLDIENENGLYEHSSNDSDDSQNQHWG